MYFLIFKMRRELDLARMKLEELQSEIKDRGLIPGQTIPDYKVNTKLYQTTRYTKQTIPDNKVYTKPYQTIR